VSGYQTILTGLFKDAIFGLPSNLHIFHLRKSIEFDNAYIGDSRPCICSFLLRVFQRSAMRYSRVFGVGIPNYAYWAS